jgi:hypothetical protein
MQLMGSFAKPQKRAFERTFRYLGSSSTWSMGFFWFAFSILSVISFLTDALQNGNFQVLWFLVSPAGFIIPLLIGVIYRYLFINFDPDKFRTVSNLLAAGIAGASRNLSVGILAHWAGLESTNLWLFRTIGGSVMGLAVFILWAFANGSKTDYLISLQRLAVTQSNLASTRTQMPEHLAAINDNLQERTKQALLPQLSAIKQLLGTNYAEALDKLRYAIAEQIRPMMLEIEKDQPKPFKATNIRQLRKVKAGLPNQFLLHDKLMVTWSSLLAMLGASLWLVLLGSKHGLLDIPIMFTIYFMALSLCKFLLPNEKQFSKVVGILLTLIFALFASSMNLLYIYFFLEYSPLQTLMMMGFVLVGGVVGPILLLQVNVRSARRAEVESQITDDLLAIAKENSLFAQRLWVFRKRWLLVLHGSVQSSLTAALTRLQKAEQVDGVVLELVKQDLRRAEAAVDANLNDEIDLPSGLSELQEVWRGICEISIEISERAKRALARSHDSSFCVNEIVKEAVSNAVRHGDATSASVSIDRVTDDLLNVTVINNGSAPRVKEQQQGIGSDMLDEICLSWSLDVVKKKVRLVAELPVKL